MRILLSAYACIPGRGSEPGQGWHWALGNALAGHEVWCLTTPEGKDAIADARKLHPTLKLEFVFIDTPRWVNYLYRFQPFVYVHYLIWQRRASQVARKLDQQVDFDLLHHVTYASLQLGSGLWRVAKPLIFGPVGGGNFAPPAFKRYFGASWYMERFRQLTSYLLLRFNPDFRHTVNAASLILAANTDTRRMAERHGAKKIALFLDSGLGADYFQEETPRIAPESSILRILWVGRIFPRKGLPLVLEALSKIKSNIPFRLTVLGDGKDGKKVPSWLKDLELEDKVDWLGYVPWNEVRTAFKQHDVFMFCSLRDSFGSQFLEAMAAGLPIITLNHQGAGDHIPDNAGIKVSVQDPQTTVRELTEAVTFLYHYPEARKALGTNGVRFARNSEWTIRIREVNTWYKQVIENDKKLRKTARA